MSGKNVILKYCLLVALLSLLLLVLAAGNEEALGEDDIDCRLTGEHDTSGHVRDLALDGDHAYLAAGSSGLVIVNVSDRENPQYVDSYNTADFAWDVVVDRDYAYVADDENGVVVVNITDKDDLTLEGQYDAGSRAEGVALSGDRLFVAHGTKGLVILDVSDRKNPTELGRYDTPDHARRVAVVGDHAYVADEDTGLVIVNVSDPVNPTEMSRLATGGSAWDVTVSGDHAYVVDLDYLVIIDIRDKENPEKLSDHEPKRPHSCTPSGVAVSGDYAYVGGNFHGLMVVNISDKEFPHTAARYDTSDDARGVVLEDNFAFIANWEDGLTIVELGPCAHINGVVPTRALEGEEVRLMGYGTDNQEVVRYAWSSSIDGELRNGTGSDFTSNAFSLGTHDISLKVKDDHGLWSKAYIRTLVVHQKPEAHIDSVSPNPALDTENVSFTGHGTDDGEITSYAWRSSEDGELGTAGEFNVSDLTPGTHTVYLKVKDDNDAWSEEVETSLLVHQRPVAWLVEIYPEIALNSSEVHFEGDGSDDGSVEGYAWRSDMDADLNTSRMFSRSGLSPGTHTIYFKVKDDHGVWSEEVSFLVEIHERPLAFIQEVTPNPALSTQVLSFRGNGTDDGELREFHWRIVDGDEEEVYNGPDPPATLDPGNYTIYFKVRDDHGVWSGEVFEELVVHAKPVAEIVSISPNPPSDTGTVTFTGKGLDDGTIQRYAWRNSTWELYNGTGNEFQFSGLPLGSYTIFLKVMDNHGVWSGEVSETFIVHERPEAFIHEITPNPALGGYCVPLEESLVAYWPFDEGDGDDARDMSGNGNDGYLFNQASWTDGRFGAALSLDGGGGCVRVNNSKSQEITTAVTIEAWIFPNEIDHSANIVDKLFYPPTYTTERGFKLFLMDDEEGLRQGLSFRVARTVTEVFQADSHDFAITLGEWQHVAVSYDSTVGGNLYVNGENVGRFDDTLEMGINTYQLNIGGRNDFDGYLDEVAIFNRALTSSEIQRHYAKHGFSEKIGFSGGGSDDGSVVQYSWRSSIDGELYNGTAAGFNSSDLSQGNHEIFLKVKDNHGLWSEEVSTTVTVHRKPRAVIDEVSPSPALTTDTIHFSGEGRDDGTITTYVWSSSLNGELHNDSEANFTTPSLSPGTHTISLKVQDNHGLWSEEATTTLTVNEYIPPNRPPIVTITSPEDGTELKGTVTIKGSASDPDGTVEKVELLVDGEWVLATGTTSWEFELDTTRLRNSDYTINVLAFDGTDYSNDTLLNLTVNNEEEEPEDDDGGDDGTGFELIGIFVGVLVAAVWWRRKNGNG